MKFILLAAFLSTAIARADFAHDQYTDYPDILLRIVSAAEKDGHFKSFTAPGVVGPMALYLRRAEYIGPLDAPFGTVQVARLFYIRSSNRGGKGEPRGHTYIVFLDEDFKIRTYWMVDSPDDSLYVDGAKLMSGKEVVMDYGHLPTYPTGSILPRGTILYDNKSLPVPEWK